MIWEIKLPSPKFTSLLYHCSSRGWQMRMIRMQTYVYFDMYSREMQLSWLPTVDALLQVSRNGKVVTRVTPFCRIPRWEKRRILSCELSFQNWKKAWMLHSNQILPGRGVLMRRRNLYGASLGHRHGCRVDHYGLVEVLVWICYLAEVNLGLVWRGDSRVHKTFGGLFFLSPFPHIQRQGNWGSVMILCSNRSLKNDGTALSKCYTAKGRLELPLLIHHWEL